MGVKQGSHLYCEYLAADGERLHKDVLYKGEDTDSIEAIKAACAEACEAECTKNGKAFGYLHKVKFYCETPKE
jgi:hypothetical protein